MTNKQFAEKAEQKDAIKIKELAEIQEKYRTFFEGKIGELSIDGIMYNIAALFNEFINAHEKDRAFFYVDRELYIRFSVFVNAVRRGNTIFKHEMEYKPLQATDRVLYLEGEKKRIFYKFREKGRYENLISLIEGGVTLFLSEFLAPTGHDYHSTISNLVYPIGEEGLKEAINDRLMGNFLLTRIQLLIDIYNYFYLVQLLKDIASKIAIDNLEEISETTVPKTPISNPIENTNAIVLVENNEYQNLTQDELMFLFYYNHYYTIEDGKYTPAVNNYFYGKRNFNDRKEKENLISQIGKLFRRRNDYSLDEYKFRKIWAIERVSLLFEEGSNKVTILEDLERLRKMRMS